MTETENLTQMIRLTARISKESSLLNVALRESISSMNKTIAHSRAILANWSVSGSPRLDTRTSHLPTHVSPGSDKERPSPASAPPTRKDGSLERVVEQAYTRATVSLDGRHFVDCTMQSCILEYSGGPVIFEGTHFSGCRFTFGGEAAMTVSMLECFGLIAQQEVVPSATHPAGPTDSRPN